MRRPHTTTRVEIVFIDYTLPEVRSIIGRDGQVRVYQNTPWVCERRVVTQWDWETVRVDMLPIQTSWREMGGVITTASSLAPGTRVRPGGTWTDNTGSWVVHIVHSVNVSDISCPESLREGAMHWCLEKLWQTRTVDWQSFIPNGVVGIFNKTDLTQTREVHTLRNIPRNKHRSTTTLLNGKNKKDRYMTVYRQM
jgi:hypothetical protein